MTNFRANARVVVRTTVSPRIKLGNRPTIPVDTLFGRAPFPLLVVAATASLLTGFAGSVPFPGFTAAATADTPRTVQSAIAFPQPAAAGVGQTVNSGSAIATLPTPNVVVASETLATSTASITFPSVTVSGEMVSGSGFVGAIALPEPGASGTAETVNSGIATLTMPLFIPSGISVAEPSLSGVAAFPPFVVNGTAEADAANAWTFQALATQLWLRGTDNVTLDGANVSAWGDVKNPTLTATQAIAADQPTTAILDTKTTVSTLNSKYLNLATTLQIRSAAFVVNNFQRSSTISVASAVFGENDPVASSTDYVFILLGVDYTISVDGNTGQSGCAILNGNPITCGTNILLEETYSAGGGPAIFYVDWGGAQVNVDYISAFNINTGFARGSLEIAEIILFPEVLSFDDQNRAIGRLAHDWGQTGLLPANHPYKTQEPIIDIGFSGNVIMPTPGALGGATAIASGQSSILFTTPVGSGTAEVTASGQGAATMPLFVASGTAEGEVSRAVTGAILFSQPDAAATAEVTASGSAAIGLATPQPSGTAEVETDATSSAIFPGFVVAGTADGGASGESISESGVSLRADQLQDASVMGDVDWWIAGVDEKLNGTEISVSGGTVTTSTGAPIFKFNDGTTNTGDQQLTAQYQFGSTPPLATIAIPAGSGRVSVWVGTGNTNDASVQASFGSNFTGIVNFSNNARFDIDFIAASASTMAVTISAGSNSDAGFYAVALATDPILTGTPAPDILWWPTTEAAGTNLNDPINGWIGFFEGSPISWDTDNFLLFAGGYVRNNNAALETLIETTFTGTAMCWVRPDNLTDDMCIFTAKHNTTNEGRMYFLRTDPVGFLNPAGVRMYKGGYRSDPVSGAQGVQFESKNEDLTFGWQHIAMSFATGSQPTPRFQFWKNGVQLAQGDFASYPTQFPDGPIHSQGNFMYGLQGNLNRNFLGKMYDLRLYTRELETVEIQRIFDATRGVVGVT